MNRGCFAAALHPVGIMCVASPQDYGAPLKDSDCRNGETLPEPGSSTGLDLIRWKSIKRRLREAGKKKGARRF